MSSLALLQLVSPALPVGGFSYSEGLEVLIQSETIRDEQQLQAWMEAELSRGAIRLEAAALPSLLRALAAWSAGETAACRRVLDLDGWLLASRESAELRAQQRQMGGSLLNLLAEMGHPLPEQVALSWPAAWAWAAQALGVAESEMVEGYLYGWVANQLSAAAQFAAVDQRAGRAVATTGSPAVVDQRRWGWHGAARPC